MLAFNILFFQKILLGMLVGALIGLEREHSKKGKFVGVRTFALISLMGTLLVLISEQYFGTMWLVLLGVIFSGIFSVGYYFSGVLKKNPMGFTTSIVIMISFLLGTMIGYGMFFEVIFLSISIAMILFSKERLHKFVNNLTEREVEDLLEFLVVLGIIYPIIPREIIFSGVSIPLFEIWLLVVIISLINFVAFITSRHLTTKKEVELISFLGGLISGWGTIESMMQFSEQKKSKDILTGSLLIINASNFLRASIIFIWLVPAMNLYIIPSIIVAGLFLIYFGYRKIEKRVKVPGNIKLSSPFNVKQGIKLAFTLIIIFFVFSFIQNAVPQIFLVTIFLSAFMSSNAAIITISEIYANGQVVHWMLVTGSFLTIMALFLSNLAFCILKGKQYAIKEALTEHIISFLCIAIIFAFVFITSSLVI